MYFSANQLKHSLKRLEKVHPFFGMSYLAFKNARIPVGSTDKVVFSKIANEILNTYYRPSSLHNGFFNPFMTSDRSNRWTSPRYGSTSLQRITTDTFSEALLHEKKSSKWGWKKDYISQLRQLQKDTQSPKIPAFDLAVWLFRSRKWPKGTAPKNIIGTLVDTFEISPPERKFLFDLSTESAKRGWRSKRAINENELFEIIGWPPGIIRDAGAALVSLDLTEIGPAQEFQYEAAERLNIVTGDNSLGKTFLLECIWWALTGEWVGYQAAPRLGKSKKAPQIKFSIQTFEKQAHERHAQSLSIKFDRKVQKWKYPKDRKLLAGLAIYAHYDGSFRIWDPAQVSEDQFFDLYHPNDKPQTPLRRGHTKLTRDDVWNGLRLADNFGRDHFRCNGLIIDWVFWQKGGGHYKKIFSDFTSCLKILSPSTEEALAPGEPTRVPGDSRDIPTLRMPYGDVPILYASAGVKRILALAYVMVWAWQEHVENRGITRQKKQRKLVLLVDEVEAHLHPRWQRAIVPSIMNVIGKLTYSLSPQVHLATHSPLVLASAEPIFDNRIDGLHHLDLVDDKVTLNQVDFVKHGSADGWLMSDLFGLPHARSLPAEQAIEEAKRLQLQKSPKRDTVLRVDEELAQHLTDDDTFWPRWRYFAEQHRAKK